MYLSKPELSILKLIDAFNGKKREQYNKANLMQKWLLKDLKQNTNEREK